MTKETRQELNKIAIYLKKVAEEEREEGKEAEQNSRKCYLLGKALGLEMAVEAILAETRRK